MLPGIYPKEVKTCMHTKTFTWMSIAALFITGKTWNQLRYPSVDKQMNSGASRQWNIIDC